MDLAVANLVDRELVLALEGPGDQMVAVDVDRAERPTTKGGDSVLRAQRPLAGV
jgi:hypothetical protein